MSLEPINRVKAKVVENKKIRNSDVIHTNILCYMSNALAFLFFFGSFFLEPNLYVEKLDKTITCCI